MNNPKPEDTPTPRTDALLESYTQKELIGHARYLERELAAANAKLEEMTPPQISEGITHTATPWKILRRPYKVHTGTELIEISIHTAWDHAQLHGPAPVVTTSYSATPEGKSQTTLSISEEGAAFIIMACNGHAELTLKVAALEKELADEKRDHADTQRQWNEALDVGLRTVKERDEANAELSATREHCRLLRDIVREEAEIMAHQGTRHWLRSNNPYALERLDRMESALATTPEQIGAELAELREFREWCYTNVGNDDLAVLRQLLSNGREDKADLDWLNASDGRGVNRLEHETDARKGHVFTNVRLVKGMTECDHYYGPTVRAAIRAARKEAKS